MKSILRFNKLILATLFAVVLLSQSVFAGSSFDTTYARILQQRIEYLKNAFNLVGISAAAEVHGQLSLIHIFYDFWSN